MNKGGVFTITSEGIFVDFNRLAWYKVADWNYKQKYLDYFATQGFAEAEQLPYILTRVGLIVQWQPKAKSAGWMKAVDVDGIPF